MAIRRFPSPDFKEPLSSVQLVLQPTSDGYENRNTTRNKSPQDWERKNIIERTGDLIHVYCELMDVQHGHLGNNPNDDDLATLMVFQFRIDSQKGSRRVNRTRIKIEFLPSNAGGEGPEVEVIAPDLRWSVKPTQDHEESSSNSELNLGTSQVVEASGKVGWSKTRTRDISACTTVTGAKNLATGTDMGGYKCATWTLIENEARKTGVPDMLTVAVLVRREDDEPFHAVVSVDAHADMATSLQRLFKKVPMDDPVLFNPKAKGKHLRQGRAQGVLNLGHVDLWSLCDANFETKENWVKAK